MVIESNFWSGISAWPGKLIASLNSAKIKWRAASGQH